MKLNLFKSLRQILANNPTNKITPQCGQLKERGILKKAQRISAVVYKREQFDFNN